MLAGEPELTAQRLRAHILVQGQRFADLLASLAGLRDGKSWRRALSSSRRS
jgi:hypothetical protein